MLDNVSSVLSHPLVMLLIGILISLITVLMDESAKEGKPIKPKDHFKAHPYRTALSIFAGLAVFGALMSQGPVDGLTALVVGYAGADVLSRLVSTTTNRIGTGR